MKPPVSVMIMTLDEEVNLPRCLASLNWCDDVVVLDSGSSDKTRQIATESGARVLIRPFDNYARQRNYGLNEIQYKNPWLLMVDADEEVSPELAAEMSAVLFSDSADTDLYRMRRKDYLLGQWLKRSSGYPTWFGRLMRVGHVRVEREINEEFVSEGSIKLLQNHLNHFPFNKGFTAWIEKHNRYSTMEAELMAKGGLSSIKMADLLSADPSARRRGLKAIVYRMPFRPLWMFVALYIVKGGFLDGKAGFIFCLLRSYYEFMINCKLKELNLRQKGMQL